eukprot:m.277583 g.277583  ORF g.277583 m.277583 type:complete len:2276 (+) comp17710_c0_seq1:68-6895(+)
MWSKIVLSCCLCTVLATPQDSVWSKTLDAEDDASGTSDGIVLQGNWKDSGLKNIAFGSTCQYASAQNGVSPRAIFRFDLPTADYYQVYISYCSHPNRAPAAKATVYQGSLPGNKDNKSFKVININQTTGPGTYDNLEELGLYYFDDPQAYVVLELDQLIGALAVDGVYIRQGIYADTESRFCELNQPSPGQWETSTSRPGFFGSGYTIKRTTTPNSKDLNATFNLPIADTDVYGLYVSNPSNSQNTPTALNVIVDHVKGRNSVVWNQRIHTARWFFLGSYTLSATKNQVIIPTTGVSGIIVIDGVWAIRHTMIEAEYSSGVTLESTTTPSAWQTSTNSAGFLGLNYHFVRGGPSKVGLARGIFDFNVDNDGLYSLDWTWRSTHSSRANVTVLPAIGGIYSRISSQNSALSPWQFATIDVYALPEGLNKVVFSNQHLESDKAMVLDAVRLTPRNDFTVDDTSSAVLKAKTWATVSQPYGVVGQSYQSATDKAAIFKWPTPYVEGVVVYDVFETHVAATTNTKTASYDLVSLPFANATTGTSDQSTNGQMWNRVGRLISGFGDGLVTQKNAGIGTMVADAVQYRVVQVVPTLMLDVEDYQDVTIVGAWTTSTSTKGYKGRHYFHDGATAFGQKSVTFHFQVPVAGDWQVLAYYTAGGNRVAAAPVSITDSSGATTSVTYSQRSQGPYKLITTLSNVPAGGVNVTVTNGGGSSGRYTMVDTFALVLAREDCSGGLFTPDTRDQAVPRCIRLDKCKVGFFQAGADRCSPCADGFFTDEPGLTQCKQHSSCPAGSFEVGAPTATSDRQCSSCQPGTFATSSGCSPCGTSCGAGKYILSACDASQDITCATCNDCQPGTYRKTQCTTDEDTECVFCDGITEFSTTVNAAACTSTSSCSQDQYISQTATQTSDVTCKDCPTGTVDDDNDPTTPCTEAIQAGVWQQIVDAEDDNNPNAKFNGNFVSSSLGGKYGNDCMVSNDATPGSVELTFNVPFDDYYEVLFAYCDHPTRSDSVKVDVIAANSPDADATQTHIVDQRGAVTRYDDTIRLGSPRYFNAGKVRVVVYRDAADSGKLSVDAVIIRRGILTSNEQSDQLTLVPPASFVTSTHALGYFGDHYVVRPEATPSSGLGKAIFAVDTPEADVFALRIAQPSRSTALSTKVDIIVKEANGAQKAIVWDQSTGRGDWFFVGNFVLGPNSTVTLDLAGTAGSAVAFDSIWITRSAVVDTEDDDSVLAGSPWGTSSTFTGFSGSNYRWIRKADAEATNATATFNYFASAPGLYDIEMTWRSDASRALNVPVTITAGDAIVHLLVDQRENLGRSGFKVLATLDLEAGPISVVLGTDNLEGGVLYDDPIVIADAVRFVRRPFVPVPVAKAALTPTAAWRDASTPSVFGPVAKVGMTDKGGLPVATFPPSDAFGVAEVDVYTSFSSVSSLTNAAQYSLNSPFGPTVTKTIDQTVAGAPTFQLIGRQLFGFGEGSVVATTATKLMMLDAMTYVTRRVVPAQLLDVESLGIKVSTVGEWTTSTYRTERFAGRHYLHDARKDKGTKSVTYSFNAEVAGNYSIRAVMPGQSDTNPAAPITITDSTGAQTTLTMDQSVDWEYEQVGTLQLAQGPVSLVLSNGGPTGTSPYVTIADAFVLMLIEETCTFPSSKREASPGLVPRCEQLDACLPGSFKGVNGECIACPSGTFTNASNLLSCVDWSDCSLGLEEDQAPTPTSDRVCRACQTGFFSDTVNGNCQACTTSCDPGFILNTTCSAAQDNGCFPDITCSSTQYVLEQSSATAPTKCQDCDICQPGSYRVRACLEAQNTICAPCTSGYTNTTNADTCSSWIPCVAGSELVTAPSTTTPGVCRQCQVGTIDDDKDSATACVGCGAGTFVTTEAFGSCDAYKCRAGTADTDSNAGTPCVDCFAQDKFQPLDGQTVCETPEECLEGYELVTAFTATQDNTCKPCVAGATFKENRGPGLCQAVSTCPAGKEVLEEPSIRSDYTCRDCPPGFFKTVAGLQTCTKAKECDGALYEETAPSTTSDRVCATAIVVKIYLSKGEVSNSSAAVEGIKTAVRAILPDATALVDVVPASGSRRSTSGAFDLIFKNDTGAVKAFTDVLDRGDFNVQVDGQQLEFEGSIATTASPDGVTNDKSTSSGGSSNNTTIIIIAAVLAVVVLAVIAVVTTRYRKQQHRKKAEKRDVIAFENPTYDIQDGSEHAVENPIYDNEDTVGGEDPGYMEAPMMHAPVADDGYMQTDMMDDNGQGYLEADDFTDGFAEAEEETGYLDVDGEEEPMGF